MGWPGRRTEAADTDADVELDVRDSPTVDLRDEPETPPPGRPGSCPECGALGYLDNINMRTRTQAEHCDACGCIWRRSIDPDVESIEILQSART